MADIKIDGKVVFSYFKKQLGSLRSKIEERDRRYQSLKATLHEKDAEIADLKREVEYYKSLATVDTLTGLKNRRALENIGEYDSLIMCDVDFFKRINDMYGHDTGDKVLKLIGEVLKRLVRDGDMVLRWGGEEFVIVLKNCTLEHAYTKASELRLAVRELSDVFNFDISMSFGVTEIADKNATVQDIVAEADEAMYDSKNNGRNQVTVYQKKR